jgi:hypothetical protein
VAVDQAGRQLGQLTVAARSHGHAELLGWARRHWPNDRRWAVEDCRHVTGRLEHDLLAAGRTRTINRLRWHLHQLDPDLEQAARRLPGP